MASPDSASVIAPAPVINAAWLAAGAAVEYVSASSLLPFRIGVCELDFNAFNPSPKRRANGRLSGPVWRKGEANTCKLWRAL